MLFNELHKTRWHLGEICGLTTHHAKLPGHSENTYSGLLLADKIDFDTAQHAPGRNSILFFNDLPYNGTN